MTDKELKRLSRTELLELLLEQTRERERLEKKLEEAERKLADRQILLENAGDIAQAALQINGVMEAAQAAARQYLENAQRIERQARQNRDQILIKAAQDADEIRKRAKAQKKNKTGK